MVMFVQDGDGVHVMEEIQNAGFGDHFKWITSDGTSARSDTRGVELTGVVSYQR